MLQAIALFVALSATQQQAPLAPATVNRWFQEVRWASDDDGGALWGKPLYGPILFVDPDTRRAYANQADASGALHETGGIWTGTLPPDLVIANTAVTWSGVHWTMVQLDLPEEPADRTRLVLHECFHRIQDSIGLPTAHPANGHLNTATGRIWLTLEYRALSKALLAFGPERKSALTDALVFRSYRRSLFPGAAAEEDRMEVHEGLAEYTGVRRMGLGDWGRRSYLAGRLKVNALKPSFALSFAYETGPAYGLLLDMEDRPWRSGLTPASSLSKLLADAEGLRAPHKLSEFAKVRAKAYDGDELRRVEMAKEAERQAQIARYRAALVTGPTLVFPMDGANYGFNPSTTVSLGEEGSVFPESQVSGPWGVLEISGGGRLSKDFQWLYVPAPSSGDQRSGKGWKLTLKEGWMLRPGPRKGDFTLVKG